MKKFASTFICVLLAALMIFTTVVSAADALPEGHPTTGKITLYKYTTDNDNEESTKPSTPPVNEDQKPVEDAEYTAYQIASIVDGVFVLNDAFKNVEFNGTALSTLFSEEAPGSLSYSSTATFENFIPALRNKIENGSGFISKAAVTGPDGKAEITNLALGVYLVLETVIPDNYVETSKPFLVQLPQWDQDANDGEGDWLYEVTAYPKDDPVTLTKDIIDDDDSRVDETTRQIGDIVNYEIVIDVPYYAADLTETQINTIKYFVTDNMGEGLTFNNEVEVTIKGTTTQLTEDTDFTVSTTGRTVITIDFNSAKVYELKGQKLVIHYSATLNELALIGGANENSAKLSFTNNPSTGKVKPAPTEPTDPSNPTNPDETTPTDPDASNPTNPDETTPTDPDASNPTNPDETTPTDPDASNPTNPDETTPTDPDVTTPTDPTTPTVPDTDIDETDPDDTKVYTYAFELEKKFNDGAQTPDASGVEFSLKNTDGKLKFVKLGDGNYVVLGDDFKEYVENNKIKLPIGAETQREYDVTDALNPAPNGTLSVKGLKEGSDYVLTEEKTVSGFSKLAGDIALVVTEGRDETGKLNGKVTATANGSALTSNATGKIGIFEMEINNVSEQFNLPQTGGAGLLAFTIGGGIVIAGAIILFSLLRKKKSAK